jgi:hypothetical protein
LQGADHSIAQQRDLESVAGERPGVLDGNVTRDGDGSSVQCMAD